MAPEKKKWKKPAEELTTDEAIERLFGKKAAKEMKKIAHGETPKKPKSKGKSDAQD